MHRILEFFNKDIHSPWKLFTLEYLPITLSILVLLIGIPFSVFLATDPQPQQTTSNAQSLTTTPMSSLSLVTPKENVLVVGKTLHIQGSATPLSYVVVAVGTQSSLVSVSPTGYFAFDLPVSEGPAHITIMSEDGQQISRDIAVVASPCLVSQSVPNTASSACPFGWVGKVVAVTSSKQQITVQANGKTKTVSMASQSFLPPVQVGDKVMVFGSGEDTITASRIIRSQVESNMAFISGTISTITQPPISITLAEGQAQPISIPNTTIVKLKGATVPVSSLASGQKIIAITSKTDTDSLFAQTIFVLPQSKN